MIELNKIYNEDCLEGMKRIPDNFVNMILCDLPYGVTNNNADKIIPVNKLWKQYKRIIKEKGIIILTSQFPFTVDIINSNRKWFKYDLIWKKGERGSGFLNANRMPLRNHEHILVFYKELPTYNPQYTKIINPRKQNKFPNQKKTNRNYGKFKYINGKHYNKDKFPLSIINFERPHPPIHPTQKPLQLFRYLIKTYSNEKDVVLDNCMGSGTTAVACKQLNRSFIGFEINPEYVEISNKRLKQENLLTMFQSVPSLKANKEE